MLVPLALVYFLSGQFGKDQPIYNGTIMLKIKNIQTFYGNIQALKDVSIEINEGEIVALIGANGAGKTTTLMSICGITPPRYGEILLDGDPIQGISAEKIVQQGIVQVPEGRRIFPDLTVQENLEMGALKTSA